ncbi:carbonic anhydrase 3-like [Penaeus indicus]|uniref:carbonic anhydrase 3-like n=1 Tax=Penaeus indicus TaxID=29960 RepID=UPI00300D19B0
MDNMLELSLLKSEETLVIDDIYLAAKPIEYLLFVVNENQYHKLSSQVSNLEALSTPREIKSWTLGSFLNICLYVRVTSLGFVSYAAELHLVHFKKDYGTLAKALKHKDGVVVLGVMVEADDNDNERLQPFVDALEEVVELGTEFHPDYNIPLDALLPEEEDRHLFFRYQGSLTTPLCNEVVTWTLFQTPIALSSNQLAQFRALISHDGRHRLQDNFRPVQPLNGREVDNTDVPGSSRWPMLWKIRSHTPGYTQEQRLLNNPNITEMRSVEVTT